MCIDHLLSAAVFLFLTLLTTLIFTYEHQPFDGGPHITRYDVHGTPNELLDQQLLASCQSARIYSFSDMLVLLPCVAEGVKEDDVDFDRVRCAECYRTNTLECVVFLSHDELDADEYLQQLRQLDARMRDSVQRNCRMNFRLKTYSTSRPRTLNMYEAACEYWADSWVGAFACVRAFVGRSMWYVLYRWMREL